MTLCKAIGYRISDLMLDNEHMSIRQLARLSGVPSSQISRIFNEQITAPRIDTILKICKAFNITLKEFFDCKYFKRLEKENG